MALAVTVPDTLEMIVGERLNLSTDFTNLIAAGDVLSSPTTTMTNLATNETVPTAFIISPVVSNNVIISVTVSSSPLRKGNSYVLLWSAVATGAGQTKNVGAQTTVKIIY